MKGAWHVALKEQFKHPEAKSVRHVEYKGQLRAEGRRGGHRGDHLVHQHLEPAVLIAAGLLAKKARALGLATKPWVK